MVCGVSHIACIRSAVQTPLSSYITRFIFGSHLCINGNCFESLIFFRHFVTIFFGRLEILNDNRRVWVIVSVPQIFQTDSEEDFLNEISTKLILIYRDKTLQYPLDTILLGNKNKNKRRNEIKLIPKIKINFNQLFRHERLPKWYTVSVNNLNEWLFCDWFILKSASEEREKKTPSELNVKLQSSNELKKKVYDLLLCWWNKRKTIVALWSRWRFVRT